MDGSIFTSLASHILSVIDSRLGGEFHSIRVHGGNNEDGRHFHFHVTHTPTQRTLRISVDLELLLSLSSEKMELWFDNLIRGIENSFRDGWATVDYRWMDDGSFAMPPSPPTHSSWLPAHDWQVDYDPIDHMPPPIPPPPPYWTANYHSPTNLPTSTNLPREMQDKLRYLQSLLQARCGGEVFYTRSTSDGMQIYVELVGQVRSIKTSITLSEVNRFPADVMADIVAGRLFYVVNTVQQTQELDPQEEFGGPDWADDSSAGAQGGYASYPNIKWSFKPLDEKTLERIRGIVSRKIDSAVDSAFYGLDISGFSTENARALADQNKPVSKKNDGKAKGRKKK